MDSMSRQRCPKCKSALIYLLSNKPVQGNWTKLRRSWNCVNCLQQWPECEEEQDPMHGSTPTCPECTSENVYSVTTELDGKRTCHCSTCKHKWPGSELEKEIDSSIWKSPRGSS
jgi:hypothetical protein